MGMFDSMKRRKAEREFAAGNQRYETELEQWNTNAASITEMIEIVDAAIAGKADTVFTDRGSYGFMLKNDEFPVAFVQQCGYIELVRAPSQHTGGYGGVSFPIFGGIRLNTGRFGGQTIPGAESMNMTDQGDALVTNERVMFRGGLRTHEWKFSKMMGMSHLPGGITTFAMSSSGKPAGIGYGDPVAPQVQFRLEIAAAFALGTMERFRAELQVEKDKHDAEKPIPPAPVTSAG
jgi:hypothetical protein